MKVRDPIVVMSAVVAFSLGTGACSSDDDTDDATEGTATEIAGTVTEWSVAVDSPSAPAGDVTFTVDNAGQVPHEFLVVKTDIAPGQIPLDGDRFPEDADGIEVIDEIPEFDPATTETLELTLEPGSYQLVCNLPGHYGQGMYTGLDVSG